MCGQTAQPPQADGKRLLHGQVALILKMPQAHRLALAQPFGDRPGDPGVGELVLMAAAAVVGAGDRSELVAPSARGSRSSARNTGKTSITSSP